MAKVEIYTLDYCPYSKKAKAIFDGLGQAYEEFDITRDEAKMQEVSAKTGFKTFPQIFINNTFIGGCDDLVALQRSNELDKMLQES